MNWGEWLKSRNSIRLIRVIRGQTVLSVWESGWFTMKHEGHEGYQSEPSMLIVSFMVSFTFPGGLPVNRASLAG